MKTLPYNTIYIPYSGRIAKKWNKGLHSSGMFVYAYIMIILVSSRPMLWNTKTLILSDKGHKVTKGWHLDTKDI